jgi:hypothetical protein
MTGKSRFKVVQEMIKLQNQKDVEQQVCYDFENFTLPDADYDGGIEALTQMFDTMNAASTAFTSSFDSVLYQFIFDPEKPQRDKLSEAVCFYNGVVRHLELDDRLIMLKHYLYEYRGFKSLDLELLVHSISPY